MTVMMIMMIVIIMIGVMEMSANMSVVQNL